MLNMIIVSQFFGRCEKNQVVCKTPAEAKQLIEENNRKAANGWRWSLSPVNFINDDGTEWGVEKTNNLRIECGLSEI